MAQQKSGAAGKSGRTSGSGTRPGGKPGGKPGTKPAAKSGTRPASKGAAERPPSRKKPKSIVNQKQTPWALIITTIAIVVFAAAVVIVVVVTRPGGDDFDGTSKGGQAVDATGQDSYRRPALPAAMAIKGVSYYVQGEHTHADGTIKYDRTPPTGGNHNQFWADCTGTVYDKAIANENAVHMLEHGAIWITYNADKVKGAQLTKLKSYVSGVDRMALSPYPNLSTPISLQAWGYQLKLSDANDPRIAQFIKALRLNPKTTPENATCSQPDFKRDPSTFGNPTDPYGQ